MVETRMQKSGPERTAGTSAAGIPIRRGITPILISRELRGLHDGPGAGRKLFRLEADGTIAKDPSGTEENPGQIDIESPEQVYQKLISDIPTRELNGPKREGYQTDETPLPLINPSTGTIGGTLV